jgi:hypothetical protein
MKFINQKLNRTAKCNIERICAQESHFGVFDSSFNIQLIFVSRKVYEIMVFSKQIFYPWVN